MDHFMNEIIDVILNVLKCYSSGSIQASESKKHLKLSFEVKVTKSNGYNS